MLGNFGGQDKGITPQTSALLLPSVKGMGKTIDAKVYPEAGHAFENPNDKTGYKAEDSADASHRMSDFFTRFLQKRTMSHSLCKIAQPKRNQRDIISSNTKVLEVLKKVLA